MKPVEWIDEQIAQLKKQKKEQTRLREQYHEGSKDEVLHETAVKRLEAAFDAAVLASIKEGILSDDIIAVIAGFHSWTVVADMREKIEKP